MKFSCSPFDITDKELSDFIIDKKAAAKKNGQSLSNQDIVSEALYLLWSVEKTKTETNIEKLPTIKIEPESQIIRPIESNTGIPKFDMKALGFYTNKETAKMVGCNEADVCRAHKEGLLKQRRNGHVMYQHIDDINEWNKQRIEKKFA